MQHPSHLSLAPAAPYLPPGPHSPQVSSSPPSAHQICPGAEEEAEESRGLDAPHRGGLGSWLSGATHTVRSVPENSVCLLPFLFISIKSAPWGASPETPTAVMQHQGFSRSLTLNI